MGHTLVTHFDQESRMRLQQIMSPFRANKIPFGRNCDREAANAVFDYHLTMFHWAKTQDTHYLKCIQNFCPTPCQILITDVEMMCAEEGSHLLYFSVMPGEGFPELVRSLELTIQAYCSTFLHITLAVSKNKNDIHAIQKHIQNNVSFPFLLNVDGLDLYHIWRPTWKVRFLSLTAPDDLPTP